MLRKLLWDAVLVDYDKPDYTEAEIIQISMRGKKHDFIQRTIINLTSTCLNPV